MTNNHRLCLLSDNPAILYFETKYPQGVPDLVPAARGTFREPAVLELAHPGYSYKALIRMTEAVVSEVLTGHGILLGPKPVGRTR